MATRKPVPHVRRRRWRRPRYLLPVLTATLIAGFLGATYPRYRAEMQLARQHVLAGSQVIQTTAGPIEYAESGAGPPVLVVHGAGGYDQGLILGQAFIGPDYRVIAPSRFGYLRTPVPADASPSAQADAHAALLDALHIPQVTIVGVSDGGPSALQFALRHPDRVSTLVLLAAKSQSAPPDSALQTVVFNTMFRSDFVYWSLTEYFQSFLLAMLGVPEDVQARLTPHQTDVLAGFVRSMHPMSLRKAGIYSDRATLTVLSPDVFPLERIAVPALIIHGKRDTLQPFSHHGQNAADRIPGARLLALEGGSHIPMEQMEEIRAEIGAFVTAHAPIHSER